MGDKVGLTPSERMVNELCQRSFLKLWTHPNPRGKHGKELCDCLVVCGSHIVIISVKHSLYRDTGNVTGWKRWAKTAIKKSVAQIAGAERWLRTMDTVERRDGRVISLPERGIRQYHRIVVALGAKGNVPLEWGDLGDGFVHVCDEYSIDALFSVLDTITDFVEYLDASCTGLVFPRHSGSPVSNQAASFTTSRFSFGTIGGSLFRPSASRKACAGVRPLRR